MPRQTYQAIAVGKLYNNTELLCASFRNNANDPPRLRDSTQTYSPEIKHFLELFGDGKGPLNPPLAVPRKAFATFLSVWDSGRGDVPRSSSMLFEYERLLLNARDEVDRIVNRRKADPEPPPRDRTASAPPTPEDVRVLKEILEFTNSALENFRSCLRGPDPEKAQAVRTEVDDIASLIARDWSKQAVRDLAIPRHTWATFVKLYRRVQGPDKPAFVALQEFQRQIANAQAAWTGQRV